MIEIKFRNVTLVNGTEHASFCESHAPDFTGPIYFELLQARINSESNVSLFGYEFNVQSTIYRESDSRTLVNRLLKFKKNFEKVFRAFLNLEIYNYVQYVKGRDIFLFPSLDIIKFIFWYYQCTSIPTVEGRIKSISNHILRKANLVLPDQRIGSVSTDFEKLSNNFLDLLNSTSDFCSELMFVYLCHSNGYYISIAGKHDFIINNEVSAEVKTIYDMMNKKQITLISNLVKKTLPDGFTPDDLLNEIVTQITRKKWICHLKEAINHQNGDIIFFNVTQSPEMYDLILYLEESDNGKSFKDIIDEAMRLRSSSDSIPVVVMVENIHFNHMINFFMFIAPVTYKNGKKGLVLSRHNRSYLKNVIML